MPKTKHLALLGILFFLVVVSPVGAAENRVKAENLMDWHLQAIAQGDAHKFIAKGNRAFKELMGDFIFESFAMQYGARLKEGYKLHYLDVIHRLGMDEYLWKITLTNYTYELFGSVTLAKEFVVGFKLE